MKLPRLRTIGFIATAGLAAYSLLGFIVASFVVHWQLEKLLTAQVQGHTTVEDVTFNPFTFSTELKSIEIFNTQGAHLVSIGGVSADFSPWMALQSKIYLEYVTFIDTTVINPDTDIALGILPEVSFRGLSYDWERTRLSLNTLHSLRGDTTIIVNKDGLLNSLRILNQIVPTDLEELASVPPEKSLPDKDSVNPLSVVIQSVNLENHTFAFENQLEGTEGKWAFKKINLSVEDFKLKQGYPTKVDLAFSGKQAGTIRVHGNVIATPLSADLKIHLSDLALEDAEPLVRKLGYAFDGGQLSADLKLTLASDETISYALGGDISIDSPILQKTDWKEPLFSARSLHLSKLTVENLPLKVNAAEFKLDTPVAYIELGGSKKIAATEGKPLEDQDQPRSPANILIEKVIVENGAFAILDRSISPPARHELSELNVSALNVSPTGTTPMKANARMQLAGEAPTSLDVTMIPANFPTDVQAALKVNSLLLKSFSPYAARYLGREIVGGKISADISATLKGKHVQGANNFVLSRVVLGKDVPGKDVIDVPIETIISLLQDENGRIKLDFPVEGTSAAPSFRYTRQLGTAFRQLLFDMATSPISLLSSAYNWTGDDLQRINFPVQSSVLDDEEEKKLEVLVKAMNEKPALELDISGESSLLELEDDDSTEEQLALLATERAQVIKDFITSRGISATRLFVADHNRQDEIQQEQVASNINIRLVDS